MLAMRKCVYAAVTKKDLVWFDTKTEDSNDLGAGGLMAKFARCVELSLRFMLCLTLSTERLMKFGWHRP